MNKQERGASDGGSLSAFTPQKRTKTGSSAAVNTSPPQRLMPQIINNRLEASPGGGVPPPHSGCSLGGASELRCDGRMLPAAGGLLQEPSNSPVSAVKIGAPLRRRRTTRSPLHRLCGRAPRSPGSTSRVSSSLTRALGFGAICLTMASIFQPPRLLLGASLSFPPDNEMLMLFGHRGDAVDTRSRRKKPRTGPAPPPPPAAASA